MIVRINMAKTIANFIEYAGEKSDLGTLISVLNNYWSVLNNLPEITTRSFSIFHFRNLKCNRCGVR